MDQWQFTLFPLLIKPTGRKRMGCASSLIIKHAGVAWEWARPSSHHTSCLLWGWRHTVSRSLGHWAGITVVLLWPVVWLGRWLRPALAGLLMPLTEWPCMVSGQICVSWLPLETLQKGPGLHVHGLAFWGFVGNDHAGGLPSQGSLLCESCLALTPAAGISWSVCLQCWSVLMGYLELLRAKAWSKFGGDGSGGSPAMMVSAVGMQPLRCCMKPATGGGAMGQQRWRGQARGH